MTFKPGQRRGAVSLKAKALQWLAQREHSRVELARKLRHWLAKQDRVFERGPSDPASQASPDTDEGMSDIERTLDELAHAGLLSEQRFTQSRVDQRQQRFGNRRIEQELRHHGLSATDQQWADLQSSEIKRALGVLRQRYKSVQAGDIDPQQLQRGQRFLAGRGFSSEAISTALRQWARGCSEDAD